MSDNENNEFYEDDSEKIVVPGRSGIRFQNRSPLFLLFMVVAAVYLMYALFDNLLYFFASDQPQALGEAEDFKGSDLPDGTYVSVGGLRNPLKGIGLTATLRSTNVFPLMGTPLLYVQTRQEDDKKNEGQGLKYGIFTGRLYRMSNLPYYNTIKSFAFQSFSYEVNPDAFVVRHGEKPGDNWYYIPVYVLLLAVAAINLAFLIKRLMRR